MSSSYQQTITQVGPAGGSISATDFSIQPKNVAADRIHNINLSASWAVDKIQVQYENPATNPPEVYASEVFGGGGSLSTFALAAGDYLTSVSGTWGAQAPGYPREEIISLQFHTHQGNQSQVFGGDNTEKQVEPFTLVAPEGFEIIGFFGAYGSNQNVLVRLGIYTRPVNTVKFGDTFYLKHATGQYLIAIDRGRYNWPQLGNTGKVTLQLVGNNGEVVKSQSRIKIRTTESVTANNDILGAFVDSHNCYYWQDGYDEDKQSWLITKVSGEVGPICYEDRVYLTNCSYNNQKLCVGNPGYVTTKENVGDWWILESTASVSFHSPPAQESSSPPTASSVIPSQPATAPPNVAPSQPAPTEQSAAPVITQVGPAGSSISATAFSIQPKTGASASKIHRVSLSSGWAVDKIKVQYENPATNPPEFYASEAFGGGGGNLRAFSLAAGDYLTSVSGTWGAQAPGYPREEIISLQFHTHQGNQSQVFGGGNPENQVEPFTLVAPEGSEIIGFFGAYGSHQNALVRLGLYTQPVQSAKAAISVVAQPSPPATAPPNVAPSPPAKAAISVVGQPSPPATAPPNVAPSPPAPTATSVVGQPSPPATAPPNVAPSEPAVTLSRQKILVFDQKYQGIAVGGGALRPQGEFTIEAWVYPATDAGKQVIYAEGETLFYLEGGELKFQITPAAPAIASVGAGLVAGSWYHVAVARAGSRSGATKLYINSVQNDNQTAIPPVLSRGNSYLGGDPDVPDSRFLGKLLEVRVWRYARLQADIEANRLYPLTGRELGLRRCWALNEGFGTILHDKTTNRAAGTVSGDAVWEEAEIPLKLKLDPQERLMRSTGLEDYGYWFREMAKQQKTEADPPFRRGRIWAG